MKAIVAGSGRETRRLKSESTEVSVVICTWYLQNFMMQSQYQYQIHT